VGTLVYLYRGTTKHP